MACSVVPFRAYFSVFRETDGRFSQQHEDKLVRVDGKQRCPNPFLRLPSGYRVPVLRGTVYRAPPTVFGPRQRAGGRRLGATSKDLSEGNEKSGAHGASFPLSATDNAGRDASPVETLCQALRDVSEQSQYSALRWHQCLKIVAQSNWIEALVNRGDTEAIRYAQEVFLRAQACLEEGARLAAAVSQLACSQGADHECDPTSSTRFSSRSSCKLTPSSSSRNSLMLHSLPMPSTDPQPGQPRPRTPSGISGMVPDTRRGHPVSDVSGKGAEKGHEHVGKHRSLDTQSQRTRMQQQAPHQRSLSRGGEKLKTGSAPVQTKQNSMRTSPEPRETTYRGPHHASAASTGGTNLLVDEHFQRRASPAQLVDRQVPAKDTMPSVGHASHMRPETTPQIPAAVPTSLDHGKVAAAKHNIAGSGKIRGSGATMNSGPEFATRHERPDAFTRNQEQSRADLAEAKGRVVADTEATPSSPPLHRSPGILSRRLSRSPDASHESGLPAVVKEAVVPVPATPDPMLSKRSAKMAAMQLPGARHGTHASELLKGSVLPARSQVTLVQQQTESETATSGAPRKNAAPVHSPVAETSTGSTAKKQLLGGSASPKESDGYLPRLRRLRERVQKARALAEATWNQTEPEAESSV